MAIKAPASQFVCAECGYTTPKWLGKCPGCGNFNTLQEELVKTADAGKKAARPALSDMGGFSKRSPFPKWAMKNSNAFLRASGNSTPSSAEASCAAPSFCSAAIRASAKAPC